MKPPLTNDQFEALRRLDASTLANAIETFGERLRNEGFIYGAVTCQTPQKRPMLGYAVTVKVRGSAPPTAGTPYADRTDWWDYVLALPAPRVVVLQDVATRPGVGSLVGAVHMNILRALGCVGVVTNGSVRDLPAAAAIGFFLFSGGVSVSHAYVHIVEVGQPVEIGGLTIQPGDLVHGDIHGVQTIPLHIAARVPAAAARIMAEEQDLIALCRSPDFSLERLRAAVQDTRA